MKLQVTVEKLNRRKSPVTDFANKSNVVEVVNKGFSFESVGQIENNLGVWHQDRDGLWAWEKALNATINTQWWYEKLRIEDLQEIIQSLPGLPGVTVAVLDTGIVGDLSTETFQISGRQNFTDNTNNVIDIRSGHGTLCASLIGASNKVFGSVNPNAKVFIAKIFTDLVATNDEIIARAIDALCDPNNNFNVDILSVSGGLDGLDDSSPLIKAIDNAEQQSVIVSAAIGNRLQTSTGYYPALHPYSFSIGALDQNFQFSTNLNPVTRKIDYLLPGENIHSLNFLGSTNEFDGTSHACAIMSGILSLIITIRKSKGLSCKAEDLRSFLDACCDKISFPVNNELYKRINPDLLIENIEKL
jgi:subtilisin family serine protease